MTKEQGYLWSAAERLADRWGCPTDGDIDAGVVQEILKDGQEVGKAYLAMAARSKPAEKTIAMLVEFVVGAFAEEDHYATSKRLLRAERLLKRIAPELLAAEKSKVPAD